MANFCTNCGNRLNDGDIFCVNCGAEVQNSAEIDAGRWEFDIPAYNMSYEYSKPKKSMKPLFILIGVFLLIGAIIGSIVLKHYIEENSFTDSVDKVSQKRFEEDSDDDYDNTADTETPVPTEAPTMNRMSLYSPNYTYKRMSDIHSSISASDAELMQMAEVITRFNSAWIEYVNYNDDTVFNYLRQGTEAYNNAMKYGQKDITEEYELEEFLDARKSDNCYYVWAHEIINEYGEKNKRNEYHWVYQIKEDNGGFYVADYTADPAYQ